MLPPELNTSYEALEASALASHPQIRAAQETAAQARMQVRLARSQANPTLGISYTRDLSTTQLYCFAGTVSIPLDWGQIRDTVRQQQRAELEKKEALRSATLTVNASLRTAFFNFEAAVLNVKSYREDVLDPSEHLMADTQRDFASGKASYLQLLNAQQTLRLARTQYLQLLLTGRLAFDAVEAVSGTPLETGDSPRAPSPPMDER